MSDRPTPEPAGPGARPLAPKTLLGIQVTVAVILIGWALHATASVSALIVAAVFVAVVLAPFDRWIAGRTGQAWLGHLVSFLAMLVVLLAFAAGLLFAAQRVAAEFPALSDLPTDQIPGLSSGGASQSGAGAAGGSGGSGTGGSGAGESGGPGGGDALSGVGFSAGEIVTRLADAAEGAAMTVLSFGTSALTGVVLVVFLALIMMVDAPGWHRRVARAVGERRRDATLDGVDVVGRMVRRYLLIRAAMGALTAVLYMGWLWVFGVELTLVWGILTFLLGFVPNLGSVVSGLLPTVYAFLTKDLGTAIAVGAGLLAIEQVIGNFIDPRIQGRQISMSPVVILTGLLIFAWIWGVPGALLSTPVLIAALVAFARIDALRPVALLMSDCEDYEALDEMTRP